MTGKQLLQILRDCVPEGKITTYGNLSEYVYGTRTRTRPITSMLNWAVNKDSTNRIWTNRVVNQRGGICNKNSALDQLTREGLILSTDGNIDLQQCPPVKIIDCLRARPQLRPEKPKHNKSKEDQSSPVNMSIKEFTISEKWQGLQFPPVADGESFTWTGFDSAWKGINPGAIAWMTGSQTGLNFEGVRLSTFDDCITHVDNITSRMHLLTIDQPTIVRNSSGRRPVEKAVAHEIGRARGGVQPANTGNKSMFGSKAPIWKFLNELKMRKFQESSAQSVQAKEGCYYLETFPALGNLGMFGYEKCPKYNPARKKQFDLKHWENLCSEIKKIGETLDINGCLISWAATMQGLTQPTKTDQDKVDAVLCMLFGYIWWRSGLNHSIVIGDNKSGYIVVPCLREDLRKRLETDATDTPVDELFSDEVIFPDIKKEEAKAKGLVGWLLRILSMIKQEKL